jgi:cytochrome c
MSSFEMNKIAGAFLGALVLAIGLSVLSDELFAHRTEAWAGRSTLAVHATRAGSDVGMDSDKPLADRLVAADAAKGALGTRACQSCHTFVKDGAIKSGPPLYGILERPIASVSGFAYSAALEAKSGNWTVEALDQFLADPKAYAKGTKMTFAGERDPMKRADLIAYLDSLADHPLPLSESTSPATKPTESVMQDSTPQSTTAPPSGADLAPERRNAAHATADSLKLPPTEQPETTNVAAAPPESPAAEAAPQPSASAREKTDLATVEPAPASSPAKPTRDRPDGAHPKKGHSGKHSAHH